MKGYAKAIVSGIVAGLTALLPALDGTGIDQAEWVVAAIAALGGFGIVWAVPNKDTTAPQ